MCCVFVCVFHLIEAEANNEADDVGDDDDDGETFPRVARQKCPLNPGLERILDSRRPPYREFPNARTHQMTANLVTISSWP